jgi:hypothetical protein
MFTLTRWKEKRGEEREGRLEEEEEEEEEQQVGGREERERCTYASFLVFVETPHAPFYHYLLLLTALTTAFLIIIILLFNLLFIYLFIYSIPSSLYLFIKFSSLFHLK